MGHHLISFDYIGHSFQLTVTLGVAMAKHFCQGVLGQKFQLYVKIAFFFFKTYLYRMFWLEFKISA